ncbi:uncharacterized protein BP5553_04254 [Venustampulla echinocandica]|uniref:Protein kinase domain-containing protein n=1 Tax=Venustampulla echinocandica TaxID=2656787 RepID=A0A370TWK7_9HELO|nr:uncharacterized protein BP5553_04254 [Venustampulla echinocandica]RDL39914.1 hypothetical protein BP5553_04254 [Venustampulla echinocandica]
MELNSRRELGMPLKNDIVSTGARVKRSRPWVIRIPLISPHSVTVNMTLGELKGYWAIWVLVIRLNRKVTRFVLSPKDRHSTVEKVEIPSISFPSSYADYPEFVLSDGLFIDGTFEPMDSDGLEGPEQYIKGVFYPVHLGDFLRQSNRYKVLNKLRHGGLATVWIVTVWFCRDLETKTYVVLKFLIAGVSNPDCAEFKLIKQAWDIKQFGGNQIALPSNYF